MLKFLRYPFSFLMVFAFSHLAFAQLTELPTQKEYKHSINLEVMGFSLGAAINYERTLVRESNFELGLSAGLSYLPITISEIELLNTLMLNHRFGKGRHQLILDYGVVFLLESTFNGTTGIPDRGWEHKRYRLSHFGGRVGYRYTTQPGILYFGIHFIWVGELNYDTILGREVSVHGQIVHSGAPFYLLPSGGVSMGVRF